MRQLGTPRLDQRSAIAVGIRTFKDGVRADLGGDLTAAQEATLERAAVVLVLIRIAEDDALTNPRLLTRKKGFAPVIAQYQQLVGTFTRLMGMLGLERVAQDAGTLDGYLTSKVGSDQ